MSLDLLDKTTRKQPLSKCDKTSNTNNLSLRKFVALAFVAILFIILRIEFSDGPINVDENIAPSVARSMVERGDFNGNWRLAENIMPYFKRDMHNFYSYNLFAIPFLKPTENETIAALRSANIALQLGALAFIWFAMKNGGIAFWRRFYTSTAIAVLPTMAFDAHLARAESLLYFLAAAVIFVASVNRSVLLRWSLAAFIIGVGTASKLTFAATAIIFLPEGLKLLRNEPTKTIRLLAISALAMLAGFAATSPYTFIEPNVFFDGLGRLMRQYSTQHLPHSNPGTGMLDWASHLALFAVGISGAACIAIRTPLRSSPNWMIGLSIMASVIYIYFATKPVFFERNISLALLASIIVAFSLPRWRSTNLILTASLIVMTYWSINIALLSSSRGSQITEWEINKFGMAIDRTWPLTGAADLLSTCGDRIIGVSDYGDVTSQRIKNEIGIEPMATRNGAFSKLPTSTLNTYLETSIDYYQCYGGSK